MPVQAGIGWRQVVTRRRHQMAPAKHSNTQWSVGNRGPANPAKFTPRAIAKVLDTPHAAASETEQMAVFGRKTLRG